LIAWTKLFIERTVKNPTSDPKGRKIQKLLKMGGIRMKKHIFSVVLLTIVVLTLAGCSQAANATEQLKNDADEFKVVRKITVINLRTDAVLYEIEGRISYTVETDGDFSIIAKTGDNTFKRDTIGVGQAGNGITYIVEQIEPLEEDPYHYEIRIYARFPEVSVVR